MNIRHNTAQVTLKDISQRTGYTINTISRALKNKEDIAPATRQMIQEVAKEMGYIGNSIAGSLRSGLTKTIAVILGDISNPHFGIMVKEIEMSARKHQYTTFVINTDEDDLLESKSIYSAIGRNVDGIILCPSQKSEENIRFLQKTGIPFVLLGRHFEDSEIDYVVCDDVKGGYLATEHLLSRGHKRILFLNGPAYISSAQERLKGYKQALEEKGIEYDPELIREVGVTSGESRKVVRKMIENGSDFSAIFAFSDMMAWEAIYMLQKMGRSIPEDFGIVGYDNIQSKMFFPFPLTSVSTSKSKMSRRAFDILMYRINNRDNAKRFNEIIDTKLIVREST